MTCKCADEVNEMLAGHNGILDFAISMDGSFMPTLLSISKKDTRSRTKPPSMAPAFCPFCGVRYRPAAGVEGVGDE